MLGVSGGVDSAVAALLLQQRRCTDVAGLFMQNWNDDGSGDCRAEDDRRDAVAVCGRLGIPFHARNFAPSSTGRRVRALPGRVPRRPHARIRTCCATARSSSRPFSTKPARSGPNASPPATTPASIADGRWRLLRGRDADKDQSYFLHALGQEQLASATLFPVGDLPKTRGAAPWRRRAEPAGAREEGLDRHLLHRRARFPRFLGRYLPMRSGEIRSAGRPACLGEHGGVFFYTLGQREGLNIGGVRGRPTAAPWFVVGKDVAATCCTSIRATTIRGCSRRDCAAAQATWIAWSAARDASFQLHRQDPLSAARRSLRGARPCSDGTLEDRCSHARNAP
jgi:tRNA-specific 2-thiouridylase